MKSKRIPPRPSATGEVIVGPGYEFRREDEQIHGHEPPLPEAVLTPVGPVISVRDLRTEDQRVNVEHQSIPPQSDHGAGDELLTTCEPCSRSDQLKRMSQLLEQLRIFRVVMTDDDRSRLREQLLSALD